MVSSPPGMTTHKRLLELDCLRGIAALMVVCFHFNMYAPPAERSGILRLGCTGVDLFFIISGFVIFLTLNKTTKYTRFLVSRFARLYPAYWACVSITFLLIVYHHFVASGTSSPPHISQYLANMTMLQYYFQIDNLDGPYWTLIIELLFYVLMLAIFLLKKLDRMEDIGMAAVLLSIANEVVFKKHLFPVYYALSIRFPLINHIPLFIAGIIFYKIRFDKITLKRSAILMLCIINQIGLYNYAGLAQSYMSRVDYMLCIVLFYALFMLYSYDKLGFIVNRPLLFLGQISYSLYLVHQYLATQILLPYLTAPQGWHLNYWVAAFGLVLPVIIILATLINRFIEVPAMNYIKGKWK